MKTAFLMKTMISPMTMITMGSLMILTRMMIMTVFQMPVTGTPMTGTTMAHQMLRILEEMVENSRNPRHSLERTRLISFLIPMDWFTQDIVFQAWTSEPRFESTSRDTMARFIRRCMKNGISWSQHGKSRVNLRQGRIAQPWRHRSLSISCLSTVSALSLCTSTQQDGVEMLIPPKRLNSRHFLVTNPELIRRRASWTRGTR